MKKANLRLMGSLCPRIKYRIQNTISFYKWFLIPIIVLFVSCQALAQEVMVQQMPSAATVSTNDFKENSTPLKIDGVSPQKEQATTFQEKITPLKIGDKIPDELWDMYFPVVSSAYEKEQYLSLGDFKDKLIILDFWATWCSPCLDMIPVMDSLQKEFKDEVQLLSVTYQKKEEVLPFLAKLERVKEQKYHLPVLVNDDHLVNVFPHNQLPHYVWIEEGVVKGITGYKEVNAENIQTSVMREKNSLKPKIDIARLPYDPNKPLFINGNGGNGDALMFHSVLAKYTRGLTSQYNLDIDSINGDRVTLTNSILHKIYAAAYGRGNPKYRILNRVVLEVSKPDNFLYEEGKDFRSWITKNGYNYEIKVPAHLNDRLYEIMQNDLKRLFPQYSALVEKRKTTCLVLVRTSKHDKLSSKAKQTVYKNSSFDFIISNGHLFGFIQHLNMFPLQKSPFPLIDETGYKGPVDLEVVADLSDVSSLNKALKKYDLEIIEAQREIDMLVIRDRIVPLVSFHSN